MNAPKRKYPWSFANPSVPIIGKARIMSAIQAATPIAHQARKNLQAHLKSRIGGGLGNLGGPLAAVVTLAPIADLLQSPLLREQRPRRS
jgi:hypothetical protein